MIQIDSNFPSGNIEVVAADDPANIRLRIRPDPVTNFLQWFHFRVVGAKDRDLVLRIENANDALVRKGWEGYRAFASLDSQAWFRVPSAYDGQVFAIMVIALAAAEAAVGLALIISIYRGRQSVLVEDFSSMRG